MTTAIRWSPEQLAAYESKRKTPMPPVKVDAKTAMQALGRLKSGVMNKTESAYAAYLEAQKHMGAVLWYRFEGIKFRLADNTFYTPDFAVLMADGAMQIQEVKGFWVEDAKVKIKVAASMYPFQFIAVKKSKDGWQREFF
jgi:hypothetical protein